MFARLRYDSGDWDYNPKVAANVLNSVVEYTNIRVYPGGGGHRGVVGRAAGVPVPVHDRPQAGAVHRPRTQPPERLRRAGGLLFSDDCNHDVNGLYARSFESGDAWHLPATAPCRSCPGGITLYRSFFRFDDGPPTTSHELNGWGDEIVHDYLRGIERERRLGVLYSNKDYGCEWDYDWRNKRFQRQDNTKFAVNIVVYAMGYVGYVRIRRVASEPTSPESYGSDQPRARVVAPRPAQAARRPSRA